ncbi:hypothetical protein MGN70_007075 [Eutypa lata]|nr:hypothetical protein MGN70_007075 [Eutypa lata]
MTESPVGITDGENSAPSHTQRGDDRITVVRTPIQPTANGPPAHNENGEEIQTQNISIPADMVGCVIGLLSYSSRAVPSSGVLVEEKTLGHVSVTLFLPNIPISLARPSRSANRNLFGSKSLPQKHVEGAPGSACAAAHDLTTTLHSLSQDPRPDWSWASEPLLHYYPRSRKQQRCKRGEAKIAKLLIAAGLGTEEAAET